MIYIRSCMGLLMEKRKKLFFDAVLMDISWTRYVRINTGLRK